MLSVSAPIHFGFSLTFGGTVILGVPGGGGGWQAHQCSVMPSFL